MPDGRKKKSGAKTRKRKLNEIEEIPGPAVAKSKKKEPKTVKESEPPNRDSKKKEPKTVKESEPPNRESKKKEPKTLKESEPPNRKSKKKEPKTVKESESPKKETKKKGSKKKEPKTSDSSDLEIITIVEPKKKVKKSKKGGKSVNKPSFPKEPKKEVEELVLKEDSSDLEIVTIVEPKKKAKSKKGGKNVNKPSFPKEPKKEVDELVLKEEEILEEPEPEPVVKAPKVRLQSLDDVPEFIKEVIENENEEMVDETELILPKEEVLEELPKEEEPVGINPANEQELIALESIKAAENDSSSDEDDEEDHKEEIEEETEVVIIEKEPEIQQKTVSRRAKASDFLDNEPASSPVPDVSTPPPAKRQRTSVPSAPVPSAPVPTVPVPIAPVPSTPVADNTSNASEDKAESEMFQGGLEFLGYSNLDAFSNTLLPSVVHFLKVTKSLPNNKDEFDFYQSYPSFMAFGKNQGQRVLQLIGKIFKHHHVYQAWNTLPSHTVTGIDEQTEAVVEANDTLLERVDKILDMLKQDKNEDKLEIQKKNSKNVLVAAWNTHNPSQQSKPIRLLHSKNILRPQLRWKIKPDNTAAPFIPLIRDKPNAKVPLPEIYKTLVTEETGLCSFIRSARESTEDPSYSYPHPYQHELDTLEPRSWQHEMGLKQEPREVKDTSLTVVDTVEGVRELVDKLGQVREVAVDLEAHSYRSYLGFTCLMQLSTRKEDFIVDTLSLRPHLAPLNTVFTNPDILKVFHGSNNDIKWLQRDLGLYVVNLFDTYHAAKQLSLPRCSLSYLLQRYCDVNADKQYQLADWRIRPLPDVMIKYAREDTHYLLYVYDCLRYELFYQGAHTIDSVYRNSTTECKQVFTKTVFTEESYLNVYHKIKIALKPQQKECLRLIFKWRDQTARNEDESTAFVLPNHMMLKISELLPHDQEGILGCCNPPPPLLRLHVQELRRLVEKARHYNPLLDPGNLSTAGEEYTPGFMDSTHQYSVESIFNPPLTPARRIKERKEIFYVPKSGPDIQIKTRSAMVDDDAVSVVSETGTISESVSSLQFFDMSSIKSDISEAVKSVTESMTEPFRMFFSKIEQLREEEKKKVEEEPKSKVVYPITDIIKPEETNEEEDDEDSNVIVFKQPAAKRQADENTDLRATTKKRKKMVSDFKPFSYEEVTMSNLAQNEEVKPKERGEMLNKGEDSRATSIKSRTSIKAGNRSGFQNFLKKKFKR